jgi:hypothetical protein
MTKVQINSLENKREYNEELLYKYEFELTISQSRLE